MAKKALIILAEGFEEIEAVTVIDVLRRAGISVTVAGLSALQVKASRGVVIVAEKKLDEVAEDFDALILPGGDPQARLILLPLKNWDPLLNRWIRIIKL